MGELDRAAICQRIATAREQSGLKQREIADLLSVSWRTIQTWESTKDPRVPWDHLDAIANATGVSKVWLIHGEEALPDGQELRRLIREELSGVVDLLRDLEQRLAGGESPPAAREVPSPG